MFFFSFFPFTFVILLRGCHTATNEHLSSQVFSARQHDQLRCGGFQGLVADVSEQWMSKCLDKQRMKRKHHGKNIGENITKQSISLTTKYCLLLKAPAIPLSNYYKYLWSTCRCFHNLGICWKGIVWWLHLKLHILLSISCIPHRLSPKKQLSLANKQQRLLHRNASLGVEDQPRSAEFGSEKRKRTTLNHYYTILNGVSMQNLLAAHCIRLQKCLTFTAKASIEESLARRWDDGDWWRLPPTLRISPTELMLKCAEDPLANANHW